MAVLVLGLVLFLARRYRHFRILRIGRGCLRRRHVHHTARQHIRFRHHILCGERLARAGFKAGYRPAVARQLIRHRDVRQRQVAVVLRNDFVGNCFTQPVVLAVRRRARRHLVDRQVAVRLLGSDLVGVFEGLAVGEFRGDRVHEAACQNVGFRDRVGRGGRDHLTGRDVLKHTLCKRHALDLAQRDRLGFGVDVLDADGEGHDVAEVVFASFIVRLAHHIVRIDAFVGDGQRSKHGRDDVVGQLRAVLRLVLEGVLALADQRLRAGHQPIHTLAIGEAFSLDADLGQRRSVVYLRSALRRQGRFPGFDRYVAVRDVEHHIAKVRVRVLKAGFCETHVRRADIRARRARGSAVCEAYVRRLIQAAIACDVRHFVAGHRMLFAVVRYRIVLANDGHDDRAFRGLHFDVAVGHHKLHIGEVVALVDEAILRQFHVRRADFRAHRLGLYVLRKRKVVLGVQVVVDAERIAFDRMRLAGVELAVVVARDRYDHFVRDRGDRQLRGGRGDFELVRYVVAVHVRHLCGAGHGSSVIVSVRSAYSRAHATHRVGHTVHGDRQLLASKLMLFLFIRVRCKAAYRVLRAVVRHFVTVAGEVDRVLLNTIRYLQRAFGLRDRVVVQIRAFLRLDVEGVLALADLRLRTRECVRRAFAVYPAFLFGQRLLSVRQRRSVVFLIQVRARQRQRFLIDLQRRGGRGDRELVRYVFDFPVNLRGHLRVRGIDRIAGVRFVFSVLSTYARAHATHRVGHAIELERHRFEAAYRVLRAVVRHFVTVAGEVDRVLLNTIRYLQRAFGLTDVVVVEVCAFLRCVGKCVGTAAHQSLGAREGVDRSFAIDPAALRLQCRLAVYQRCAVVLLAQVCTLQRYIPLVDRQRAGLGLHCELIRHIIAFAIQNLHGIDQMLPCLVHVNHISADAGGYFVGVAFGQVGDLHRVVVGLDGGAVVGLGQVFSGDGDLDLLLEVRRIGGVGGHIGGFILRFCADYLSFRIRPVNEVVVFISRCSGAISVTAISNGFGGFAHCAAANGSSHILYGIGILGQGHGNRSATGYVVQRPFRTGSGDTEWRITCGSGPIGGNTGNLIALGNVKDIQSNIRTIQLLICIVDLVNIARSSGTEVRRSVIQVGQFDIVTSLYLSRVLDHLHRNEGAVMARPLVVELDDILCGVLGNRQRGCRLSAYIGVVFDLRLYQVVNAYRLVHLSPYICRLLQLVPCILFQILDCISRVSVKYGIEFHILQNCQFVQRDCFAVFCGAPVLEIAEVVIQCISRHHISNRKRRHIRNQEGLYHLLGVRIDEFYLTICVCHVDNAIHMVAVVLPFNNVPAHSGCLIQLDIHQIGNLGGGRCGNNMARYIRSHIVSSGDDTPAFPQIRSIDGAAAYRIIVVCICKISLGLNFADKELGMGLVGDWIGDQGIRFHQPIATTIPACTLPFGGCRYLLIELVVLTIDRPAVEIFVAQIDRVLIVAGDERHLRPIITIINKRRRQRPLYVITFIRLVISDPDRFSVLRIAIFLPLGNQRQIAGHLNRIADFVFLAICIYVMRQVVVDRRKHVVQHGRRCPRLVRVVNGRIYRVANACCTAVLIGIFLCFVRIVRFIYQAVTRVCHRHHSKRCERVAAAGICTCDLRRASVQAGHNPLLNGCDLFIVRTPFTCAAIYHLGAASRHQRSDECLAVAHGDHC